ncbi:MAG: hypothetical protein LLG04_10960 [Parachlamydia sp.]|nr:hypothetical protein [Parachlamydia sp.]
MTTPHDEIISKLREMHPAAPEDYVADALRVLNVTSYIGMTDLRRYLIFRDLHDAFSALLEPEITSQKENS